MLIINNEAFHENLIVCIGWFFVLEILKTFLATKNQFFAKGEPVQKLVANILASKYDKTLSVISVPMDQ